MDKSLFKHPQVQFIEYNYPELKEDANHHYGTLGTIIRLLPLFENNKYDTVWITDVDVPAYFFDNMLHLKFDLFLLSFLYYPLSQAGCYRSNENLYSIVAGQIVSRVKFPMSLFTEYIQDLANKRYYREVETINMLNADKKKPDPMVPYGMDEHFMNVIVKKYIATHMPNLNILLLQNLNIIKLFTQLMANPDIKHPNGIEQLTEIGQNVPFWDDTSLKNQIKLMGIINQLIKLWYPYLSPLHKGLVDYYLTKIIQHKRLIIYTPVSVKEFMRKVKCLPSNIPSPELKPTRKSLRKTPKSKRAK